MTSAAHPELLRYAIAPCDLGLVLLAHSAHGVRALLLEIGRAHV